MSWEAIRVADSLEKIEKHLARIVVVLEKQDEPERDPITVEPGDGRNWDTA